MKNNYRKLEKFFEKIVNVITAVLGNSITFFVKAYSAGESVFKLIKPAGVNIF